MNVHPLDDFRNATFTKSLIINYMMEAILQFIVFMITMNDKKTILSTHLDIIGKYIYM